MKRNFYILARNNLAYDADFDQNILNPANFLLGNVLKANKFTSLATYSRLFRIIIVKYLIIIGLLAHNNDYKPRRENVK